MRGISFVAFVTLIGIAIYADLRRSPEDHSKIAALDIHAPSNLLTHWTLKEFRHNPAACFAALESAGVQYVRLEPLQTAPGCMIENAALVRQTTLSWGGDVRMSCPLLTATMVWERHDIQPLAERMFGQKVARIRHFGTYACRNIYHRQSGPRSEHAQANALDLAGFVLEDGEEISVRTHWDADDARGKFLHAIRDLACGRFTAVLSPEFNKAHADHFHLDMGQHSACH